MNTETGELAREPLTEAMKPKFDLRNVTREQLEAAYLKAHNGVRRPAMRRMARDLAKRKVRVPADVMAILKDEAA